MRSISSPECRSLVAACLAAFATLWVSEHGDEVSLAAFAVLGAAGLYLATVALLRGPFAAPALFALVGANAGLNAALGVRLGGWPLGVALGGLNALAAWRPICRTRTGRAALGYANLVLPMSWPIVV